MENEQTNKTNDTGDKSNPDSKKPEETVKQVSIVDEARAIRDEIVKAKEDLKKENDRKEKLQTDELLSSSAGGKVETTPAKVDTNADYAKKVMANDLE